MAIGDYDNDGFEDIFVAGVHRNTLYHNNHNGTFADITRGSGLDIEIYGLGVAGYHPPVFWGVYITTFVFWIGIGHAGTLISAILFLLRSRWRVG